jgi:hypothetical protein
MHVLAIDTAWVGVVGTLLGAAVGGLIAGIVTLKVERGRQTHERQQYWKRDQYEALTEAEALLRSVDDMDMSAVQSPDIHEQVLDVASKLRVLLPKDITRLFLVAYSKKELDLPRPEWVSAWNDFTNAYKKFLGIE